MKTASTFKVGSPDMVVYVSQAQQISFVEPTFLPVSKHLPESHSEAQGELRKPSIFSSLVYLETTPEPREQS